MADTEPKGAPEVAPEQPKGDDPRIPKARLDQEVAKRKTAEERMAVLEEENRKLKEPDVTEPATPTPPPPPAVPGRSDEDMTAVMTKLQDLEVREARRELAQTLDLTAKQAEEVHGVLQAAPGLQASEALLIAQGRNTELFGSADQRGYNPAQHSSLRPTGGGPPPAETTADRIEAVRKIPDAYERRRAHEALLGEALAAESGWDYKRK